MNHSAYFRRSLVTAVVMVVTFPVIVWGVLQAAGTMANAPITWIPLDNPERAEFELFREHFEVRDSCVVSWQGCTVDDERLRELGRILEEDRVAASGLSHHQLIDRVLTGYSALRDLMAEPLAVPREQAIERLQGILVGSDGRTSCAVIVLTEYGAAHKAEAVEAILTVLEQELEIPGEQSYLAGSPVEALAIDAASERSLRYYLLPSGLLVLVLGRVCLKSWRFTLAVIAVAAYGELLVLSIVYFWGASLNAVLIVMAPLVFVLTVSSGVHLVNYYYDAVRNHGVAGAPQRAFRAALVPCALATLTTAIGMGSLVISGMVPVRQFGAISALGVIITTLLLFLLLPGLMARWPLAELPSSLSEQVAAIPSRRQAFTWLAAMVNRYRYLIFGIAMALMVAGAWGLTYVRTSVNVINLLVPDSRTVWDYRWLETNVGPVVPIEIVIWLDRDEPLDLLQKIQLLRDVQGQIGEIEVLGGTMSAATFVPNVTRQPGLAGTIQRARVSSRLESQREGLIEGRFLYETEQHEQWRITTRAPALIDIDYGQLMDRLEEQVEPVLDYYREEGQIESIRATYTGTTPLVDAVQRKLLQDLAVSFLTALLLVALVMMLVLRSFSSGLVAMLPNLFPTLVLFGAMGWLDQPIDIGSMMTASVALGIAIDGTLHYLTWFRHEVAQGHAPSEAIGLAYRHCGTAMWQTTIICGLGLLVFALSDFVPTARFAWMMLFLLLAALLGDLVQLPALLVGPFRRLFARSRNPVEASMAEGRSLPKQS